MSQTSHLSRYRPAIFVITGAAAAYSIYVIYTTFSEQPAKSGLRRSNAGRRPRPSRFMIHHDPPLPEAPLGAVLVSQGDTLLSTDVHRHGAPTVSQVRDIFPNVSEDVYEQRQLDVSAIESVMNACYLARGDQRLQVELRRCGVEGISEAMETRDVARILSLATPLFHQIVDTDHDTIQQATFGALVAFGLTGHGGASNAQPDLRGLDTSGNAGNSDVAETEDMSGFRDANEEPEQGLKGLLYHIAETDAKRKAYEHRGIHCEECGEKPIRGVRWHCLNCPDFDLCSTCEASTAHQKTHVFSKIKIPLPVLSQPTRVFPLWYPGASHKIFHTLPAEMKTSLKQTYDFDEPHIDAYFDQFTSIANVRWKEDPTHIHAAIDRRAFNKALTCERWPNRFRPNALYDRMFAFYDTDNNALIGFTEFLSGIAYLRGAKRFKPLRRALQGFDIDGDGYLDRRDFLRLLRAKYEIQKLVVNDMIEGQEREQTHAAMDTLHSSQPISSIFSWEEIPQGEERTPIGKARDANGDLQPLEGTKTILEDNEGWSAAQHRSPGEAHEQLYHHLSRFEEMLSSPTEGADSQDDGANGAAQNGTAANGTAENGAAQNGSAQNGSAQNGVAAVNDMTVDAPLDEDIIWQITQEGFNEVLDPMFKAKEEEHRQVIEARPEIERWSKEIDEAVKRKAELRKALSEELQAAETVDPLLATAMNSLNGSVQMKPRESVEAGATPAFKSDIVPTDHESLTKKEEEIAQKPLDELLSATGYSTIEDQAVNGLLGKDTNGNAKDADTDSESSVRSPDSELGRILGLDGTSHPSDAPTGSLLDPTMPQNRPNSSVPSPHKTTNGADTHIKANQVDLADGGDKDLETPPSQERLEYLGTLALLDCEIEDRGGPGRLSFDEVEAILQNDTSKELRGLVGAWLEWASF